MLPITNGIGNTVDGIIASPIELLSDTEPTTELDVAFALFIVNINNINLNVFFIILIPLVYPFYH